jgi:signal recognition particle subunit SEC65
MLLKIIERLFGFYFHGERQRRGFRKMNRAVGSRSIKDIQDVFKSSGPSVTFGERW